MQESSLSVVYESSSVFLSDGLVPGVFGFTSPLPLYRDAAPEGAIPTSLEPIRRTNIPHCCRQHPHQIENRSSKPKHFQCIRDDHPSLNSPAPLKPKEGPAVGSEAPRQAWDPAGHPSAKQDCPVLQARFELFKSFSIVPAPILFSLIFIALKAF